jgi:hypothetical protein
VSLIDQFELSSLNGVEFTIEVVPILYCEVVVKDLKGEGQASLVRPEYGMMVSIRDDFLWYAYFCLL